MYTGSLDQSKKWEDNWQHGREEVHTSLVRGMTMLYAPAHTSLRPRPATLVVYILFSNPVMELCNSEIYDKLLCCKACSDTVIGFTEGNTSR